MHGNGSGSGRGSGSSAGNSRSQPQRLIQAYVANTRNFKYGTTGYYDTRGVLIQSNHVSSSDNETSDAPELNNYEQNIQINNTSIQWDTRRDRKLPPWTYRSTARR